MGELIIDLEGLRQVLSEELAKISASRASEAPTREPLKAAITAQRADSEFGWRSGHAKELWMAGKITGEERPGPWGRKTLWVSTADCSRYTGIRL